MKYDLLPRISNCSSVSHCRLRTVVVGYRKADMAGRKGNWISKEIKVRQKNIE